MNILSTLLFLFGFYIIVMNCYIPLAYFLKKTDRSYSTIPILGGACSATGLYLWDDGAIKSLAFIPLFLDPGCLFLISFTLYAVVTGKYKSGPKS